MEDLYRNLGPLQWDGPGADSKALTLCVEDQDYMGPIKKRQEYLDKEKKKKSIHFSTPFSNWSAYDMCKGLGVLEPVLLPNSIFCQKE
ncbi:hypothetical protein POPTR_010G106950v4 [Populus trichocarpa]|uniref:Uncharacterized protein n=1 Tax=Populus trichocarpa TaxID=3694 RepID=A0A3N7GEN7_POPTR|nr:hypothetical protein POPTR_010G106950v4 [Populus trichocarpa]